MKTFKDLEFETLNDELRKGVVCRIAFDNGYGASVVSHTYSYGGKLGLYELAVLNKEGEITYETSVTDDVIGHLTPEEVTEYMGQIQKLTKL